MEMISELEESSNERGWNLEIWRGENPDQIPWNLNLKCEASATRCRSVQMSTQPAISPKSADSTWSRLSFESVSVVASRLSTMVWGTC